MRPWIKRTLIGLFGAGVLFGGLAACSHHRHHGPFTAMSESDIARIRERVVDKAGRELALDAAQKERLGRLADALQAQHLALRGGAADPRAAWQEMVSGAQFDRAKAQAWVDGKTAAVQGQAPAVVGALGDFYDGLNAEQQRKLRDHLARAGHGHGWFR